MIVRFFRWFNNQTIKRKIIIIYIPLVILPLIVLGYVSNSITSSTIIDKTKKNISDNSRLITRQIDAMIINAESCANVLIFNINKVLGDSAFLEDNSYSEIMMSRQIINQLNIGLTLFPTVESATFVSKSSRIYSTDSQIENQPGISGSDLIRTVEESHGSVLRWFPMQYRYYLVSDNKTPVLTLGKKIILISNGEVAGYLFLNLNEKDLAAIFKNIGTSRKDDYFIIDTNGFIVASQDSSMLMEKLGSPPLINEFGSSAPYQSIAESDSGKVLVTATPFSKMGWMLVNRIALWELTKDNIKTALFILFIGFLCIIFTLAGAAVLSRIIANPVTRLSRHMLNNKDGNIELYSETGTSDEIGILASAFNTMIGRIRELLQKVDYEQKKKREFELALIQEQIKPHFLYNTLEVIYAFAEMQRMNEVRKVTRSLAEFYRGALSKGRELVTIEEEMNIVRNYLLIQRTRYSDIFDFEMDVEERIYQFDILKLTIQPLVENAIYHGIKMKAAMGRVKVQGYLDNGVVIMKVIDDGIGMNKEKIRGILGKEKNTDGASFGLKSVDERIRIYFGDEYGLTIESEPGAGTVVIVRIPARRKGADGYV